MGRYDATAKLLRSRRLLSVLLAVLTLVCTAVLPCHAEISFSKEIDTYAQSVFMQCTDTGDTVYQKAADVRRSPASLTKIMTALIVLESCEDPAAETVTVPTDALFSEILAEGGVNIALKTGETLTVKDLLYAVMLPSACDAAELLAWHFGKGNVSNFVDQMNEKCRELGLENTRFANPHGLEAQLHYSTAADIAVILREALTKPLFREIIHSLSYTIPATEKSKARTVNYTIAMLSPSSSFYYEGMAGVKSGYTSQAGRCLASIAVKDGISYLLVVMGANLDPDQKTQNRNLSYDDTKALYDYAFNNFSLNHAVTKGAEYGSLPVNGGAKDSVPLVAKEDAKLLCYKNAQLTYKTELPDALTAPVSSEVAGTLSIYFNDECLATVDLIPAEAVEAVVPTTTQKPSPYTGSAQGSIFTNDPVTVILLLSLAVIVLLSVLIATLLHWFRAKKHR